MYGQYVRFVVRGVVLAHLFSLSVMIALAAGTIGRSPGSP